MALSKIEREEYYLLTRNSTVIAGGVFGCQTELQVESCIGFARYLDSLGVTRSNYRVVLKLLETNKRSEKKA